MTDGAKVLEADQRSAVAQAGQRLLQEREPIVVAYADPPYPGQAKRHYGKDGDPFAGEVQEVDHAELIQTLERDYPDGWALSTSVPALADLLALCPESTPSKKRTWNGRGGVKLGTGVRVGAWIRSAGSPFPPSRVMWTWEPVIFRIPHWRQRHSRDFVRDSLVASQPLGFLGNTITGQKPPAFCYWIFDCLGLSRTDRRRRSRGRVPRFGRGQSRMGLLAASIEAPGMKPVVYLAGPYSNPDPVENMHNAIKLADSLLDVCVPMIPHLTGTWHLVSPKPYPVWLELDLALMARCDIVFRFGGASSGADAEVVAALEAGQPVVYTETDLRDWITCAATAAVAAVSELDQPSVRSGDSQ